MAGTPRNRHPSILTSLEEPPTPAEIDHAHEMGARYLDIDLDKEGADAAVKEAKALGMPVTAYHVGMGGGRVWKEESRNLRDPAELAKLTEEVRDLVRRGASYIHLDNVHNLGVDALERCLDAVKAGGALAIVKNSPERFKKVFTRRPDLKPPYALLEHTARDADDMNEAKELAEMGVETFLVEFEKLYDPKSDQEPMTTEEASSVADSNPWLGGVILIPDEARFDNRPSSGAKFYSTFGEKQSDASDKAVPAGRTKHADNGSGRTWADEPRVPAGQPGGGQWTKAYEMGREIGAKLKAMRA